jgi:outer membrane murein-binding lipoprotein Lpp
MFIEKLKKLAETNDYAGRIISSLELHLRTGGKVGEVVELVNQALVKTGQDRQNLATEHVSEVTRLENLIQTYDSELEQMSNELTSTITQIAQLGSDINDLTALVAKLQNDIEGLNEREEIIKEARRADDEAFQVRQARDGQSLQALNEIIPALELLYAKGGDTEAFAQVEKTQKLLAKGSPLEALVEVSKKFDPPRLLAAVNKLKTVYESVQEASINDQQREQESVSKYTALIGQISAVRNQKMDELGTARSTLANRNVELTNATNHRDVLLANIQTTTAVRDATLNLLETTDATYKKRIADADSAIKALETCLDILTQNQSRLGNQEDNADNTLGF